MRSVASVILAIAAVVSAGAPSHGGEQQVELAPFQLVRSLQLVQDRIADGDQASLPMQQRILQMIDLRLKDSMPSDFADQRNFRALMVYAMSGGNPRTVDRLVSGLVLDEQDARLSAGLLKYVRGNPGAAAAALNDIEPKDVSADLSPFLALVKGTIFAGKDPAKSLELLDQARLLGPGTLIEEAALRRSMALAAQLAQPARFVSAASQYVRRFLRSPYASQFADGFVAGVVAMHDKIDLHAVAEVIAYMTPEQAKVTYMRIARRAAIDRIDPLLAFATEGLKDAAPGGPDSDPRAELYWALAEVATSEPGALRGRLDAIRRDRLSASDALLLDAAKAILTDVIAPPATPDPEPQPEPVVEVAPPVPTRPSAPRRADETVDYAEQPENAEPEAEAVDETVQAAQKPRPEGPEDAYVADARSRLQAIDDLLKESSQ